MANKSLKVTFLPCQSIVKHFSQITLLLIRKWQTVQEWHERYHCDIWRDFFSLCDVYLITIFFCCVYMLPCFPKIQKVFDHEWTVFGKVHKYSTIQILRNHPQKKSLSLNSNHRLQASIILHFREKSNERKPGEELSKRDCTSPIWTIVGNLHGISVTRWVKVLLTYNFGKML